MQSAEQPRHFDQPPDAAGGTDATDPPAGADSPVRLRVERLEEFGGDPACWLARVCPDCGKITEGRDPSRCASCGEPLP